MWGIWGRGVPTFSRNPLKPEGYTPRRTILREWFADLARFLIGVKLHLRVIREIAMGTAEKSDVVIASVFLSTGNCTGSEVFESYWRNVGSWPLP
jgi:hypothetical protein